MNRSHNFSAGPAILPVEVLQKAKEELLDYQDTGSSIMEMSHRGPEYTEVDAQARQRLTKLLGLGDEFEILFLQGGASTQFLMAPYNYLYDGKKAAYLNTGTWSKKAIKEAKLFGQIQVPFTSEDSNFSRVPAKGDFTVPSDAEYLHFTSNNTIFGTQYRQEPEGNGIPLVCDASSDFLSRPLDISKYGILYGGAQKNAGPAGLAIVIIRKDFLEKAKADNIPSMMSYKTQAGTMFNTPPTFSVYLFNLVLEWLQKKGGLAAMDKQNQEKAGKLYAEIDSDDFYRGTAEEASRSLMNVCFRLPSEDLEKQFLNEAKTLQLNGLKGHRSVGGIRASIYNACPPESVDTLISFMKEFKQKNG